MEENIVGQDAAEVDIAQEDGVWEKVPDRCTYLESQHFIWSNIYV